MELRLCLLVLVDVLSSLIQIYLRSCTILVRFEMALNVLLLSCAAMFAVLRVYAIYGNVKGLFVVTFMSGLVNPAITLVSRLPDRRSPAQMICADPRGSYPVRLHQIHAFACNNCLSFFAKH
ncbi:hypothetical protein AcW1_009639 [Taiwanofungus camphoratus]|nr:hypothetical protein AcW1_009639 [Antrodia cinnamomea]